MNESGPGRWVLGMAGALLLLLIACSCVLVNAWSRLLAK